MKPGILAFAFIICILSSCNPYNRPPLINKITKPFKNQGKQDNYLVGVGVSSGVNTELPPEARLGQGYWDKPANVKGEPHIIIDIGQQKVFYYIGATRVGISPMSSGKEGYGTPKGTYKIIQKDANYKSGTYGVLRSKATNALVNGDYNTKSSGAIPAGAYFDPAPMPYWMRITGGYGMHVGFVAGYPVSHGCVRLPEDMAKNFFYNTPVGTKVTIK